jgi:hypothetical protein
MLLMLAISVLFTQGVLQEAPVAFSQRISS